MTTFFEIIKTVCTLGNEEIPSDFATTKGKIPQIKQYINDTLQEICTKYNFTFRERVFEITLEAGKRVYDFCDNPFNILENGVRIIDSEEPLGYISHDELDKDIQTGAKPTRYSVYGNNLIFDATPDADYEVKIKYLTSNFAYDSQGQEKQTLVNIDDTAIIPDYFIKTLNWGAYALLRQSFKVDSKYSTAKEKYLSFLSEMIKNDGYTKDENPRVVLSTAKRTRNENSF